MSTVILNENGIRVERSNSTYVKGGVSTTSKYINIVAGLNRIMDVREPSTLSGDGVITICGDWNFSVGQDLNLLLQSTTIGDLPPYSELASTTTTNARVPRPTETTVEIGDQTFVLDGVTLAAKIIQIVAGEAKVAITLTLAQPASPGLAPQGLSPKLHPFRQHKGPMGVSKKLQILGAARPTQARPTETRPIQAHPTQARPTEARPTHDRNHPQLISPDVCHDQDVGHNRHLETAQGEAEGSHGGCDQGVKYQLVPHTFEACGG